jgi:hypothetical protein
MALTGEQSSFHDQLLIQAGSPAIGQLDRAGEALIIAQSAGTGPNQDVDVAREDTRQAARLILRKLCERDDTPIMQRAAWSAAYHTRYGWSAEDRQSGFEHAEAFAAEATSAYQQLREADALLRQPGASVFRIMLDGPEPSTRIENLQTTYQYMQGDGKGLHFQQYTTNHSGEPHHSLTIGQRPVKNRQMPGSPHWMRRDELWHDMVHNVAVEDFIAGLMSPGQLASQLVYREQLDRRPHYLIGDTALNEFFNAASGEKADRMLGDAVRRGFHFLPRNIYE